MSSLVTERPREPLERPVSMESVRHEILSFGTQIHEYLSKVEANVEDYKFNVQKSGDGVEVEVNFKALIRPKHNPPPTMKVVPK